MAAAKRANGITRAAVIRLREGGATWNKIAEVLDVRTQTAQKHWRDHLVLMALAPNDDDAPSQRESGPRSHWGALDRVDLAQGDDQGHEGESA